MSTAYLAKDVAPFERLRKPISFLLAAALGAGALATVSLRFMSSGYEIMEMAGMFLLVVAALGRVWSLIYIAGRKDRELCRLGPYSLCRNPLYLFSFLGVVGFFLAIQNPLLTIVASCAFLLYYRGVIRSEERRLQALFGNEFDDYRERVPRFWPRSLKIVRASELTIRPKLLERGLLEIVWFLLAIIGAEVLEALHASHGAWQVTLPF